MNKKTALSKIFNRNEYDLVRAAKLQANYDELYDDIDAQDNLAASFSEFYALTPMHHLQQKFRDVFIQTMKHKELAEKLAEFNVFVRTATSESALGESAASHVESAGDYIPFGKAAIKPLASALRTAGDKLGEKNAKHREEIKKAATEEIEGSSKPSYEAILRISATALAESCETMLLQLDHPEEEFKAVIDYLVNDRMQHALQKKIWTLNTASDQTPILNLARNLLFSVHILEKSGGIYFGAKSLIGARYNGPTVKMGGYDIQLEKYLRRQFIVYDHQLYIPLKKKEVAEKSINKKEILKSMGPELALILLAEGGRVIQSKEEKAALDSAFAETKRGFVAITLDEIKQALAENDKFITKISGKKAAALKLQERLNLLEGRLSALKVQMQQRRKQGQEKTLHTKLQKHKNKIQDSIGQIERTANKLSAMFKGLELHDAGNLAEYKVSKSEHIDAKRLAKLPADMLLPTTIDLLKYYKHAEISDESQVVKIKQNLIAIKRALLFKMLDHIPTCFSVSESADGSVTWQPKELQQQNRVEELKAFKQALVWLNISIADKKSWIENALVELQERINQSLVDVEEKLQKGRHVEAELRSKNNPDALNNIKEFNYQVALFRDYLLKLEREVRGVSLQDFALDESLHDLKNIRLKMVAVEKSIALPVLTESFMKAKNAPSKPDVAEERPRAPSKEEPELNFIERIWQRIAEIFGFTKKYVVKNPVKAGAIGTVVLLSGGVAGAAACATTTALLIKAGLAGKAVLATKVLVESSIAGATMAEAALLERASKKGQAQADSVQVSSVGTVTHHDEEQAVIDELEENDRHVGMRLR